MSKLVEAALAVLARYDTEKLNERDGLREKDYEALRSAVLSDNMEKNRFLHQINKLCEKHPHYQKVWQDAADNGNFSIESNVLSFVEELMDDAIPPGCILVKDEPALWWDGGNEVCGQALRDWDARTGGTLSINYKIPLYIAADGYKSK